MQIMVCYSYDVNAQVVTWQLTKNGRYFTDDIWKCQTGHHLNQRLPNPTAHTFVNKQQRVKNTKSKLIRT